MSEHISRTAQPDGAIDRTIDRAVRTMMQVDPPAGLRRRVLARLETPAPRASLVPRLAIGLAAAAALVLAVLIFKPVPEPSSLGLRVSTPPASVPAPSVPPAPQPQAAPAQASAPATARGGPTDTLIPMPRIGNVFGTRDGRVAPAAAGIEDVVFPATPPPAEDLAGTPHAIGIPQLTIAPLQVDGIRVEPMPTRK